ncbi:MAG: MarR family transcriptional regulator [Clostridia bacterium]|nr:MarR family transcriptional regulator [Clostridia bacterium]
MKLEWMGRYRELVRALIYYSNCSNHSRSGVRTTMEKVDTEVSLSKHEYQVLEYILEFQEENKIQAEISRDVGLLPCMVTKITKRLLSLGLIERYRLKGNRKSIILKPTPKGEATYWSYCNRDIQKLFQPFFAALENFSDQELAEVEKAIRILSRSWGDFGESLLEKMPEKTEPLEKA